VCIHQQPAFLCKRPQHPGHAAWQTGSVVGTRALYPTSANRATPNTARGRPARGDNDPLPNHLQQESA
jgi:hypothetical protein